MATPLDAAAGIAGLISLSLTVFYGCVKGFIVLSTARHIGKDGDYLRCMIEWEHYRLFEWSQQAGLDDERRNLALNWPLALDLLQQLDGQLNDTSKLQDRYGLILGDPNQAEDGSDELLDPSRESSLKELSLRINPKFFSTSSRAIHEKNKGRYLRRLQWAVIDKGKLEKLLHDVRQLTGYLWDMLAFDDRRYVRDTLDKLLRNAIAHSKNDHEIARYGDLAQDNVLGLPDAARLKRNRLDLEELPRTDPVPITTRTRAQRLKNLRLKTALLDPNASKAGKEQEITKYGNDYVLTELKLLSWDKSMRDKLTYRIENLAILLNENIGPSFRVLRCRGLIKRVGEVVTVFELPILKAKTPEHIRPACRMLSDLQKGAQVPYMTTRLNWAAELAETILQLHTAGWVHEEIRPDHVLFFQLVHADDQKDTIQDNSDLSGPFLSGFGYARESSFAAASEVRIASHQENAYRHWDAYGENKAPFRPQFDVYALGLCLIEIGLWTSIHEVLGISHSDQVAVVMKMPETLSSVREKLACSLPRKFVDAVMMAITYQEGPQPELASLGPEAEVDRNKDGIMQEHHRVDNNEDENQEEESEDDDNNEDAQDDNCIDIQQSIVSLLKQCL